MVEAGWLLLQYFLLFPSGSKRSDLHSQQSHSTAKTTSILISLLWHTVNSRIEFKTLLMWFQSWKIPYRILLHPKKILGVFLPQRSWTSRAKLLSFCVAACYYHCNTKHRCHNHLFATVLCAHSHRGERRATFFSTVACRDGAECSSRSPSMHKKVGDAQRSQLHKFANACHQETSECQQYMNW